MPTGHARDCDECVGRARAHKRCRLTRVLPFHNAVRLGRKHVHAQHQLLQHRVEIGKGRARVNKKVERLFQVSAKSYFLKKSADKCGDLPCLVAERQRRH